MKPIQMVMEGIIPLEQQVMSKLTKALNYRRMMDRIRAAKVVVPPPPVPNTPKPGAKCYKCGDISHNVKK